MGFTVLGDYHVVPWVIGDDKKAEAISNGLEERGILVPAVRYPAVPKGKELIRFMPMAINTKPQLDRLIEACVELGKHIEVNI
jgi:7-keto-8-aminopelargonate synthetase-like enzyme